MIKRVIVDSLSGYDFDGDLDDTIKKLSDLKNRYKEYDKIELDYDSTDPYSDSMGFVVWGAREETVEEKAERTKTAKKIAKEKADKIEAREKAELTRLKSKYE